MVMGGRRANSTCGPGWQWGEQTSSQHFDGTLNSHQRSGWRQVVAGAGMRNSGRDSDRDAPTRTTGCLPRMTAGMSSIIWARRRRRDPLKMRKKPVNAIMGIFETPCLRAAWVIHSIQVPPIGFSASSQAPQPEGQCSTC